MRSIITKKEILWIQNFVTKILRTSGGKRRSLQELSEDNCSEMSRLAGCFILESWRGVAVHVLKGNRVFGSKKSHDILAVQEGGVVHLVDSSVWQFFPRKRNIFVSNEKSLQDSLRTAQKIYGGVWKVSEKLSPKTCLKEKDGWLEVIKQNNKG